jgi:hypothetical protein
VRVSKTSNQRKITLIVNCAANKVNGDTWPKTALVITVPNPQQAAAKTIYTMLLMDKLFCMARFHQACSSSFNDEQAQKN